MPNEYRPSVDTEIYHHLSKMFRKKPDPKGRVYDLFVVVMLKDRRSNITYIDKYRVPF